MRHALGPKGEKIEAGPNAPREARCPECKWPVALRHRRTMSGKTWFWRHKRGGPDDCPLRYRPM